MGKPFKLTNGCILVSAESAGGLYNAAQLKLVAEIIDEESAVAKVSEDQRLTLFFPVEKETEILAKLKSVGLGSRHYKDSIHQPTTCLGALCPMQKQDALSAAMKTTETLSGKESSMPVRIGINGCEQCCVPTHTLDISVVGDDNGYKINIGGKNSQIPEMASFVAESVPAEVLPTLLDKLIANYTALAEDDETMQDTIERAGLSSFIEVLAPYSQDASDDSDPFGTPEALAENTEENEETAAADFADLPSAEELDEEETSPESMDLEGLEDLEEVSDENAEADLSLDEAEADLSLDEAEADLSLDEAEADLSLDEAEEIAEDEIPDLALDEAETSIPDPELDVDDCTPLDSDPDLDLDLDLDSGLSADLTDEIPDLASDEETSKLAADANDIENLSLEDETTDLEELSLEDETTDLEELSLEDETTDIEELSLEDETTDIEELSLEDETTDIEGLSLEDETTDIDGLNVDDVDLAAAAAEDSDIHLDEGDLAEAEDELAEGDLEANSDDIDIEEEAAVDEDLNLDAETDDLDIEEEAAVDEDLNLEEDLGALNLDADESLASEGSDSAELDIEEDELDLDTEIDELDALEADSDEINNDADDEEDMEAQLNEDIAMEAELAEIDKTEDGDEAERSEAIDLLGQEDPATANLEDSNLNPHEESIDDLSELSTDEIADDFAAAGVASPESNEGADVVQMRTSGAATTESTSQNKINGINLNNNGSAELNLAGGFKFSIDPNQLGLGIGESSSVKIANQEISIANTGEHYHVCMGAFTLQIPIKKAA